ncbi:outer membrane beta-barrel protein [Spirosoma flavum]|uniref:Outer membrane beta-barrel protein n=1 Tax=Spirosoma flavum TaxID=2048557 RepID=A0ABW6ANG1_9BACT
MKTVKHLLTSTLLAASIASFAQTTTVTITTDSMTRPTKTIEHITSDFSIYVGVNNLSGSLPTGYDFRPIGSRFIALGWQKRIPLSVNGPTKFRLVTGPEVAWNNFMFTDRNTLVNHNGQLEIEQADADLRKSKLVTAQLNLPVMLNMAFRSGLTLSVGAYAGIRLDSYTKVKPESGSAVRTHGSYNLNQVRWGLTTELGFRGTSKLFFRYEPNSPFRTGKGPDASVWAVGVKL